MWDIDEIYTEISNEITFTSRYLDRKYGFIISVYTKSETRVEKIDGYGTIETVKKTCNTLMKRVTVYPS